MTSARIEELDEFRASQRKAIVEAAERVFLRHGFLQSNMSGIAAEAGISRPTLYKYYSTLDDLALAVQMRSLESLNDTIRKYLASGGETAVDRLQLIFEACLDFYDENPDRLRFTTLFDQYYSQQGSPPGAEAKYAAYLKQYSVLDKLIERGQQEGSLRPGLDPHKTAAMVENTMLAMLQRMAVRGESIRREQDIVPRQQLVQLFKMMTEYLQVRP